MNQNPETANSLAKGLHDFFRRMRELNQGRVAREVFADEFKCAPDDYVVFEHLCLIAQAIDKLSRQVEATTSLSSDLKVSTAASLAKLKGLIGVHCIASGFGNISGQISDADLTALAFLNMLISKEFPAATIAHDELGEIRSGIEGLLKDIEESGLAPDVKTELKKKFVHALSILDCVKYFGADGLWSAFGASAVEVSRSSSSSDVSQKGLLKRCAALLNGVFKALEKADAASRGIKAIEHMTDRIGILG